MGGNNVGILDIFVIELAELPIGWFLPFGVFEFGNLPEDSHLFDQALQTTNVDREACIIRCVLDFVAYILLQFLNPD